MAFPTIRSTAGLNLYAVFVLRPTGQIRDVEAGAWDTIETDDWGDYDVALTPADGSGLYQLASLPSGLSDADELDVFVHRRAGGSPVATDEAIAYVRFPELAPESLIGTPDTGTIASDIAQNKSVLDSVDAATQSIQPQTDKLTFGTGNAIRARDHNDAALGTLSGQGTIFSAITTTLAGQITSLSSKLLQYVRFIVRKDAWLKTDQPTTWDEINADTGGGAGTYDNETDSQQALRDQLSTQQSVDEVFTDLSEVLDLIGAPDNGTLSADLLAIATLLATVNSTTQTIEGTLGTPDEGSVSADIAQNLAAIATVISNLSSFDLTITPLVSAIDTNVDELLSLIGTPDNGTLAADHEAIAALAAAINSATQSIKAQTDLLAYVNGSLRAKLASDGLDSVLVESGITPSTDLVNDTGTQLSAINARQALALVLADLMGRLTGADTGDFVFRPVGKPAANARITGTGDLSGNRDDIELRAPD